ncbi:MAG: hypothetical protein WCI72_01255 [archaeon]
MVEENTQLATQQSAQPTIVVQEAKAVGTGILQYLENSLQVLEKVGISIRDKKESQLVGLLQEVSDIDPAKVLNIAQVVQYSGAYNELVRDNVRAMKFANRYGQITELSDSVIEDANVAVEQLKDGKIDYKEKARNFAVKIVRGTPASRFDKVKDICEAVNADVKKQIDAENAILNAYVEYRSALKEAEADSKDLLQIQAVRLETAKQAYIAANQAVDAHAENDAEKARLQGVRDRLDHAFKNEDRKYQLWLDVSQGFTTGYAAGEVLMAKLASSHEGKQQIYRRGIVTLELHDSLFTAMSAAYSSILGGLEAAEVQNARTASLEKGLEHLAQFGADVGKKVIEAGYGPMIHAEPIKKAVDALIAERTATLELIGTCRTESEKNAAEVSQYVEDGKQRYQKAVENFYANKAA